MDVVRSYLLLLSLNPGISPICRTYVKSLTKCHLLKSAGDFLKNCFDEQVLPRSLLPSRLLNFSQKPFDSLEKIVLRRAISVNKYETKIKFKEKANHLSQLKMVLNGNDLITVFNYAHYKKRLEVKKRQKYHSKKLQLLISRSKWNECIGDSNVINLSSTVLSDVTKQALNFGMSFFINDKLSGLSITKAFSELEKFSKLHTNIIHIGKGLVYSCFNSHNFVSNLPLRFMKAIINLKKNVNLHFTKADKAKSIVIMDKIQYNVKMFRLLSDTDTYVTLNKNPVTQFNKRFNSKLRTIFHKVNNVSKKVRNEFVHRFKSINATLPYLYGLVKTHKAGNPMRPIISTVGSAPYKLSKYLVKMLSPLVGTISDSHIKNNVDLLNKLNNAFPPYGFKMVSFDVKSLFTKVPINDLLTFLKPELNKHTFELPTDTIVELIKLCVNDNKFIFDGNFYKQKFGLSMGNPLSPVLSNLYMEFFEIHLLSNIKPNNVTWFRYIDDILCFWPANVNLDHFLQNLNNLTPSIKFTHELEIDLKLPFLDVHIHRGIHNDKFDYSVYRKPTANNSFIHFYSGHSDVVKRSTFITMFLRALRIVSPEFFNNEINNIYSIGKNLKYPYEFLSDCFSRAKRSHNKSINGRVPPREKLTNVIIVPYSDRLNGIRPILKKLQINLVFSFKNTIKNILIKNSPYKTTGCVYKLPCMDCPKFYIGQTGRDLSLRIKEHKYAVRTAKDTSALFCHVRATNHAIDWNNCVEIITNNKYFERLILESITIKFTKDNNFNLSPGAYITDEFIENKILDDFKLKELIN